ncbi:MULTISPECIES: REP-associated tyrosine transposase [unclassified Endozoicomonas]
MGRSRYKFTEPDQPHFMTITVLHWISVFTRPETVAILLDSMRYMMSQGMKIHAYVILENHLHLLAQSQELDRDIAKFKAYTARQLLKWLTERNVTTLLDQLAFYKKAHKGDRAYQFWQEGVHPELIQSESMMKQKVEYIHQNPVKRGYVDRAEYWRYSSASNYVGVEGLLEVDRLW